MTPTDSKDWCTENADKYHAHKMDVVRNREQAQALLRVFTGPTASAGKVAPAIRAAVRANAS